MLVDRSLAPARRAGLAELAVAPAPSPALSPAPPAGPPAAPPVARPRACPAGAAAGVALALAAIAAAAGLASLVPEVRAGADLAVAWPWVPPLGIELAFRLDGLAMVFALMIASFAGAIAVYARSYLGGHAHLGRFFLYLGLFTAAMLGLVLADDVIVMFVFWELTTVA
ncbi:MAG: hypothetical protein AAFZ09_06730, partial [Pseudomonadota bacterium]